MPDMNVVLMAGRLTYDPEVRYLKNNTAVCDLQLATTRKWRKEGGEQQEETCFVTVTCFGKMAENAGKYLAKGRAILVRGHLKFQSWEKDGIKRTKHSVLAEELQYLDKPSGGTQGGQQQDENDDAARNHSRRDQFP